MTGRARLLLVLLPAMIRGQARGESLDEVRSRILASVRALPRYTCVQTVNRTRFAPLRPVRNACSDPSIRRITASLDRYKLEVTVSEGSEIFSWPGDTTFQSSDVEDIVGTGALSGTGDFARFLISIFGGEGTQFETAASEILDGRSCSVYRYRVPASASRYQFRIRPRADQHAILAYEGRIWIDFGTPALRRITIEVPALPSGAETCRIETVIDYRTNADFLIPATSSVKLWDAEGTLHHNVTEYGSCRRFGSESRVIANIDAMTAAPARPIAPISIPPDLTVRIRLRSVIDSDLSYAGEEIQGELVNSLALRGGAVIAPAGTAVYGRIVLLRRESVPSLYVAVGLRFDYMVVDGNRVPLTLTPVPRSRAEEMLNPSRDTARGIGVFLFRGMRAMISPTFFSDWKTASAARRGAP